jgi:hypothetical protein
MVVVGQVPINLASRCKSKTPKEILRINARYQKGTVGILSFSLFFPKANNCPANPSKARKDSQLKDVFRNKIQLP